MAYDCFKRFSHEEKKMGKLVNILWRVVVKHEWARKHFNNIFFLLCWSIQSEK